MTTRIGTQDDPVTGTDSVDDTTTVVDRLRAAGLSGARIQEHLRAGRVCVDGAIVTDPDHPAPPSARLVLVAA